tara:strand:+ start:858 stop:1310 length:453 start_codon:yes stop_codon:yes gene_type:complete
MEIKEFIVENLDIVILVIGIILSLALLKLATKILFRLIIFLVILIGGYVGYQQIFEKNIIDDTYNLYCHEKTEIKCTCFVQPILAALENKFPKEELDKLKNNKLKCNTEFIKAYRLHEQKIKTCLNQNGENNILEEIVKDIKKSGLKILK